MLNGEGSLLYPGSRVRRYTGQPDVDVPVSGIRFELLREGIEDYERLWMLPTLGDREFADRVAARLVRGLRGFSSDPDALFEAGAQIASRLQELGRRAGAAAKR